MTFVPRASNHSHDFDIFSLSTLAPEADWLPQHARFRQNDGRRRDNQTVFRDR
jgi:hypothetical protein